MKKAVRVLLGVYNLICSAGAIFYGSMMIGLTGEFAEYPKEWIGKLPFESWVPIGLYAVVVFGLGNLIAAILTILKKRGAWILSSGLGLLLLGSMIAQGLILQEWYLPTGEFMLVGFVQLLLSIVVFFWGK